MILRIKIAEIINPAHIDHFKFFETVCVNRGFKFSVFYERKNGLEWLLDESLIKKIYAEQNVESH